MYLQSALVLMSLIGKDGKVEGKVDNIGRYIEEESYLVKSSAIYAIIIFSNSNELLVS